MATFATLPGDLLTAVASYVDTQHFVVAVAADGDARAAVRRGVDEAERALWWDWASLPRSLTRLGSAGSTAQRSAAVPRL